MAIENLHIKLKEAMELESLTVKTEHQSNHRGIFQITQEIETVDCEGDNVPMTLHCTVTQHQTLVLMTMGAHHNLYTHDGGELTLLHPIF